MKILFNLLPTQPIGSIKFHGGGKYGIVVFKHLVQIAPECVAVYYDDTAFLDPNALSLISSCKLTVYRKRNISLYDAARRESGFIYSPLFNLTHGILPPSDIQLLFTLHGLRLFEMRSDAFKKIYFDDSLSFFHRIVRNIRSFIFRKSNDVLSRTCMNIFSASNIRFVTVSVHSKYSAMSFFPNLIGENIKVYYSPSTLDKSLDVTNFVNPYGKYWLMVSGNRWLKNGARAIIAFDELFSERPDLEGNVVITGLKDWKELKLKIKNRERFILVGYVDEIVLAGLYHNAYALIYPSLNEGFGYPPLEAMYYGCPVIGSSIASIPEICGDAIVYFNPYLISEIKMRVLQIEDNVFRDKYIQQGYSRQRFIEEKQNHDLDALCKYILSFIDYVK